MSICNRKMESIPSTEPNDILQELLQLQKWKDRSTIKTLQRIFGVCQRRITGEASTWQALLSKLLIFVTTENIEDQQTLLAGRIFCSILSQLFSHEKFEDYIVCFLQLNKNNLQVLENDFQITDPEMVKLIIIHSCLSIDINGKLSYEIYMVFFHILRNHCITYTGYTLTGFRILKLWLEYTEKYDFWKNNNNKIEEQLYCLVISNWDNCINDVAKWNATEIFPIYLRIMQMKYPFFLKNSFDIVLRQLSWRNPTKYVILKEIYKSMENSSTNNGIIIENDDIKEIVENLPRSHLKHVTTKFYLTVWGDLSESNWLNFYEAIHPIVERWERENNLNGLQLLWDLWFKSTLPKFSTNCFHMLWYYFFKNAMLVSQSFLVKLAVEKAGIKLTALLEQVVSQLQTDVKNGKITDEKVESILQSNIWISKNSTGTPLVLDDERECVRLNGFAVYCQGTEFISETEYNCFLNNTGSTFPNAQSDKKSFNCQVCKRFIYLNAKAASNTMRKGIMVNFEIFIIKVVSKLDEDEANNFRQFIHEFILNCFEINSCYQRKIMGLSILRIVLDSYLNKSPKDLMNKFWIDDNKNNWYTLLRLCLDNVQEIRDKACEILSTYLASTITLTNEENEILFREAIKYCCSSKFYQVCGGAKLLKIITAMRREADFSNYLLEEAERQLAAMKIDILKATAECSPFYGTIRALLEIYFSHNSNEGEGKFKYNETQRIQLANKLMGLLEEAANFFLSSLSPKSQSNDIKYSSSFAEMGMAIQEIIYNSEIIEDGTEGVSPVILSPAHQTIISCIWMSLATICQLAGELTYMKSQTEEICKCSINIVVKILMKCRHKGVIEAAGCVLVRLMNNENLPQEYFMVHLDKLLNLNSQDKVDLTRRGAGQTILFHKLVANGNKKQRPLLNIALKRILERLKISMTAEGTCLSAATNDNPIARQIHFLCTVVSDKSLYPALVQYTEEISLTCLHYLGSAEWSIRNASLQLFGAIIPRLIGSSTDSELDFSTGYSIEHFVTHYPRLAVKLIEEIKDDDKTMPLLTLLSKMTVAGCDYIDYSSSKQYTSQVAMEIYSLFNHPVVAVRNLAAKTHAAFIPPHKIPYTLLIMANTNISDDKPNFKHCYFLTQVYLHIRAKHESICWNTEENAMRIQRATDMQLKRVEKCFLDWCQDRYQINYVAEATCIEGLLLSVQLKHCHPFKINNTGHMSIIRKIVCQQSQPGFWQFIDRLTQIHWQFANFDECLTNNPDIFYNVNQYTICLMNNARRIISRDHIHNQQSYRQLRIHFLLHLLQIVHCSLETNVDISQLLVEFIIKLSDCCTLKLTETDQRLKILHIANKFIASKINFLWKLGTLLLAKIIIIPEDCRNNETFLDCLVSSFDTSRRENESEPKFALHCLTNFLENNHLNKTNSLVRNKIIETLVAILEDEIPETRSLVIKSVINHFKQFPKIISISHQSTIANYSELYLYDILQCGLIFCLSPTTTDGNHHNVVVDLKNFIKIILRTDTTRHSKPEKGNITNPFTSDEGYREDGKICDILIYLITCHLGIHQTRQLDVDKLIEIGNHFQMEYIEALKNRSNCSKLSTILNCNGYDYLSQKTQVLYDIIGERQYLL